MERPRHVLTLLLLLLLSTLLLQPLVVLTNASSTPTEFIRASCRATRYVDLCIHSLSSYASSIRQDDEQGLAVAALSVSLNRSRSVQSFVARLATRSGGLRGRECQAVRDCIENVGDSVDRLGQSIKELGRTGRAGFSWHMSNVQTWVSAALTDENTCLDGFSGMDGEVKAAIRRRIVDLAQVTSNALALVNRFASRHRPRAGETNP